MFAAAVVVSLALGMHMFTHDLSPLLLAMFLVVAHFPMVERPALRVALGATLALFWISPLYFALLAWHCVYLLFPALMLFAFSAMRLAQSPSDPLPLEAEHAPAL
jgi:TctA family transporter